ncbi:hypothetical protein AMAG_17822 [Allomyces macrogynus ATCC 38327]|uniref:Uncharacterized protein n=1 Tax=Allomyces macrogynus (strain ATCC 38327) TaxID=578462 RepID=A0A0L0S0C1_ALLM3|nr:hypothetical protein AMAG_17822 [Allomyces macrogynus ATCC 38327]|eukprot:KNE55769.1 hypothetical protein AMAG_17822 [Allomyces macrogynus ATCC 38327]
MPELHLEEVATGPGHNGATVSSPRVAQPTGAGSFYPAALISPPAAMSPALFGVLPAPRSRTASNSVLFPPPPVQPPPVQPPPVQPPLASIPILGPTTSPVFIAYTLTQLASGRQALRPVPVRLQEVDGSSLGALAGLRAQASRLGLQTVLPLVTDAVGPESLSNDVLRAVGMVGPAVVAPGTGAAGWRENGLRSPPARSGDYGRADNHGHDHGYEQAAHADGQSPWVQSAAHSAARTLLTPIHPAASTAQAAPPTSSLSLAMGPGFIQSAHEGHQPALRGPAAPNAPANCATHGGGSMNGHHVPHHHQYPGSMPEIDVPEGSGLDRVLCPSIPASSLQSPWLDAPTVNRDLRVNMPIADGGTYGAASTIAPAVELHGYHSTDLGAVAEHAYPMGGAHEHFEPHAAMTTSSSHPTLLPLSPVYNRPYMGATTTTSTAYAADTLAPSTSLAPADMAHLMEQYAQATGFAAPMSSAGMGPADTYAAAVGTHSYPDAQYQYAGAADMDLDLAGGYYESPQQMDVPMPLADHGLPMPLVDHDDNDAWREVTALAAAAAVSAATSAGNDCHAGGADVGKYPSLQATWAEVGPDHGRMGGAEASTMYGAGVAVDKAAFGAGAGMWGDDTAELATMGGGVSEMQPVWSHDGVHWADRPGPGL